MARYYSRTITPGALPKPPVGPLTGFQTMKGARAVAVHRAQDRVVGLSKRIIAQQSLQGTSWLVPNTNPTDAAPATRTYPDATTWRTTLRVNTELTPGCMLRMAVVALPSGQTQQSDGAAGFEPSGAFGRVRANLTWTDADAGTDTTTTEVAIPASTQTYAATRTDDAEAWTDSIFRRSEIIYPDGTLTDTTVLRQWTRPPITVTGTIDHLGGARPINVCLYEIPVAEAREADDANDEWTSAIWDSGVGYIGTSNWPFQERISGLDGDQRGVHRMLEVHAAQASRLGPQLWSWTPWKEDDADPAAIAELYAETTSNTSVHLTDSNITTWTKNAPGWSMSAGANAFNQSDNGQWVYPTGGGYDTATGAVPVIIRIYGGAEAGNEGRVVIGTEWHSYITCAIPAGAAAWHDFFGWLETGLGPEDPRVAVPIFRSTVNTKWTRIYAINAYVARMDPAA
jgi:hypothetical protein